VRLVMKIISNKSKHNIIDPQRRDGEGKSKNNRN